MNPKLSPMGTSRQILTFLFVDIVKSTDFKGSVEEDVSKPVFDRCFAIFAECMPADPAAGKMQTNTGDGMYAWFPSPTDAVETALRIQWRFHGENWPLRRIEVRQGLDMGDASTIFDPVHQEDQPYTFRTHVTARIMDLAQPGQILMSRDVRSMVSTTLGRHPFARDESPPDADLTLQRPIHGNYRYKGDKVDEGLEEPIEIAEIRPVALGPCVKPGANDKGGYPCDGEGRAISGWTPWVGDIVPGISPNKWQLEQRLGVGGFGTVWLARDLSTDDVSAFKFCDDRLRAQSFVREWKLFLLLRKAVSLDPALRPNIAVLQSSSLQSIKGDDKLHATPPYWIQSDYYPEGNILEWALRRHGKTEDQLTPDLTAEERHEHLCKALALIDIEVRLNLWVELARTVHAVHHHGITHRDIKPTNILIRLDPSDGSPHPVLADFGIGTTDDPKSLEAINQSQWGFRSSDFIEDISRTGTALYRPQEALLRAEPTHAWDIHALAVLLYQFVRGDASLPLSHSWDQHVDDPILRADIRQGVLDGDKRWPTAAEFAESVAERDERRRVMEEENAREQLRIEKQKAKRRRVLTVALLMLSTVACGCGVFGWLQWRSAAILKEQAQLETGRAMLERARAAANKGNNADALLLAGRAIGYRDFGRLPQESESFSKVFPPLLGESAHEGVVERDRATEATEAKTFLDSIYPPLLPMWANRTIVSPQCVVFSPDSTRLAFGFHDNTIQLWDAATGKPLVRLQGHAESIASVSFTPNGNLLASGSDDHSIKLWDVTTGQQLSSIEGHKDSVTSVCFSPDGKRLVSGSRDCSIKLWDAVTGKHLSIIADLLGHTDSVTSVVFSPDGNCIASGSLDGTIKLWDAGTGRAKSKMEGDTGSVISVAFDPDGSHLASGSSDRTIRIWDVATGRELINLRGHKSAVTGLAFTADGGHLFSVELALQTGPIDQAVKFWDIYAAKDMASLSGMTPTGQFEVFGCLALSPDGSRLAIGSSGKVQVWDASASALTLLWGHTRWVKSVALSPDGTRLASSSDDKSVKVWDAASGKELASFQDNISMTEVAFSPDGNHLVGYSFDKAAIVAGAAEHETFKLWDAITGKDIPNPSPSSLVAAQQWLAAGGPSSSQLTAKIDDTIIRILPRQHTLDLTAPLRAGLAAFEGRKVIFPALSDDTPMIHYRQDTLAQLADLNLTPERRAELRMELCTKSSQFRAATALWQRLLQGEWPGFEGATVPKDQAPPTIPADSPIRRLYLIALIDATKHPQIHGHPTICQTAAQIAPVLTKEMMDTPTISLAMMSLMQTLAKDDSPDMKTPREALLLRLIELASKEWLEVLHSSTAK